MLQRCVPLWMPLVCRGTVGLTGALIAMPTNRRTFSHPVTC